MYIGPIFISNERGKFLSLRNDAFSTVEYLVIAHLVMDWYVCDYYRPYLLSLFSWHEMGMWPCVKLPGLEGTESLPYLCARE